MSPTKPTLKNALDTPEGPLRASLVQRGFWRTTSFFLHDDRLIVESRTPLGSERMICLHREMAEDYLRTTRVAVIWWLGALCFLLGGTTSLAASLWKEGDRGTVPVAVILIIAGALALREAFNRSGSVLAIPGAMGPVVFLPRNPSAEEVEKFVEACVDAIRKDRVNLREAIEESALGTAKFDPVSELFRFRDLLDRGIVTREEFDAAAETLSGYGRRRIGFGH
ncbi:MAG: hypothetical protein N3A38_12365 [Planctomycetota bacterium]|nr:hypothetical protein [Planctomycetota bacterium]